MYYYFSFFNFYFFSYCCFFLSSSFFILYSLLFYFSYLSFCLLFSYSSLYFLLLSYSYFLFFIFYFSSLIILIQDTSQSYSSNSSTFLLNYSLCLSIFCFSCYFSLPTASIFLSQSAFIYYEDLVSTGSVFQFPSYSFSFVISAFSYFKAVYFQSILARISFD